MAIACPINTPVKHLKSVTDSLSLQLVAQALVFRPNFVSTHILQPENETSFPILPKDMQLPAVM